MIVKQHFPLATNAQDTLDLIIDATVPVFDGPDFVLAYRKFYQDEAVRFLDALQAHASGGFVDAILGELLSRKASIFRVTS